MQICIVEGDVAFDNDIRLNWNCVKLYIIYVNLISCQAPPDEWDNLNFVCSFKIFSWGVSRCSI